MKGTRKNKQERKRSERLPKEMISHPPSIGSYNVTHGTRLRFLANAAFAGNITYQNLLDTILWADTTTVPVDVFHTVKIRKVEAWVLPTIGSAATLEVEFSGVTAGSQGTNKIVTDTSMGIQPAHVSAAPGRESLASKWQLSSTAVAFALTCPSGSVIDVELSFKNNPGEVKAAQNVSVAATAGSLNFRGLDGAAVATTVFTPAVGPAI
jgi:hypothetical protein